MVDSAAELTLPAFAKINLILRVLRKRKDGYHSLQTVFQTVDLHDFVTVRIVRGSALAIQLAVEGLSVPADRSNLIWRACESFQHGCGIRDEIRIELKKCIPLQSGLGGGSSDAAAALIALSRLYGWPLSRNQLLQLASKLGADVPFFFYGGTALGSGRGDRIRPLPDWPNAYVLLVHSDINCSTADIYMAYDRQSHLLTPPRNFIKIHLDQRPETVGDLSLRIHNDLEQVVFTLYPELGSIKKRLLELGAVTVALSGSGSTVFGLFQRLEDLENAAQFFPACSKSRFLLSNEYKSRLGLEGIL